MNISCRMTASGLRSFLPGFSIYKSMLSGNGGVGRGVDMASCLKNSLGNPNVNEHILEMCKHWRSRDEERRAPRAQTPPRLPRTPRKPRLPTSRPLEAQVYLHQNKPGLAHRPALFFCFNFFGKMENKRGRYSFRSHVQFQFHVLVSTSMIQPPCFFLFYVLSLWPPVFFSFIWSAKNRGGEIKNNNNKKKSPLIRALSFLCCVLEPRLNPGANAVSMSHCEWNNLLLDNGQFSVYKLHFIFFSSSSTPPLLLPSPPLTPSPLSS